jgi:hypothetical protein
MQDVTNPISIPSLYYILGVPFFLDAMYYYHDTVLQNQLQNCAVTTNTVMVNLYVV